MAEFVGWIVIGVLVLSALNLIDVKVYVGTHVDGKAVLCLRCKDVSNGR